MKLRPLVYDATSALLSHNMNLNDFLVEWDEMRKNHYNGEISYETLEDWKLCSLKNQDF